MVLPLLKLGTLALKTLSKPFASRLKQQAVRHPRFRQLIVNMAQMQRRIYGHATDVEIRPLNEEKAVQAAVDLIGELFVFSVAGILLIFEVQRSSRSEARKEELRKQELANEIHKWLVQDLFVKILQEENIKDFVNAVRQKNESLAEEVELLKQRIQELEQIARGRGLTGILKFRQDNTEIGKAEKTA
ncbi:unnamed protein product [Sphenostylis stenocarpa]|uniref:OPA3-like protein n=1 Tax=Sphenostylis stenocarpa TaxID=92480 RepID=A0AA86VZ81_9FABA|nr:unnamed protein product [Sphenostylis stenocarpa]